MPRPDEPDEDGRDAGDAIRAHLLQARSGALATLSVDPATEGFPFGSVVPFALTERGAPFVLIADIAQHTRNLRRDPRCSLLVSEVPPAGGGDPQAGWRVTLIGRMRPVTEKAALEALHARYEERVPAAPGYFETHGFGYWALDLVRARWIGGFGEIEWVEPDAVLREPHGDGLAAAADRIIEHMNADHEDALLAMCEGLRGFRPATARMESIDRAGFLVRTRGPDRLVHFSFGREILAAEARAAFVDLTRTARAKIGGS